MKNFIRLSALAIALCAVSSCAYFEQRFQKKPVEIDALENGTKMDFQKFFNGEIEGFAITQDLTGKITGTQTVKMTGKWDANKGVLTQSFTLADGTKDARTWLITVNNDGTFDAVGHDIAAPATGKTVGNAAQMLYSLRLNGGTQGKTEVRFEDRMYLVDEKSMIMISNFKRMGSSGKTIMSLKKQNGKNND